MFPAKMRELLMDEGTQKSVTYTAQLNIASHSFHRQEGTGQAKNLL